jgi:hypothetical protein
MRIGAATMQCQRNVRHDPRTKTTQFDLFAATGGEAVPTPAWGALPEETRSALTRLMVQLVLDHVDDARGPLSEEARHDI